MLHIQFKTCNCWDRSTNLLRKNLCILWWHTVGHQIYSKYTPPEMFSYEFCEFLQKPFFYRTTVKVWKKINHKYFLSTFQNLIFRFFSEQLGMAASKVEKTLTNDLLERFQIIPADCAALTKTSAQVISCKICNIFQKSF